MLTAGMSPVVTAQLLEDAHLPTKTAPDCCVFDLRSKLLPDTLSQIDAFGFLTDAERRFVGHIQGRSYVNLFAALERLVDDETESRCAEYGPADPIEEAPETGKSKQSRQRLFRRMDRMLARPMPAGYRAMPSFGGLARGESRWGIAALGLALELFKQVHFDGCSETDTNLSPMFRNAFLRE